MSRSSRAASSNVSHSSAHNSAVVGDAIAPLGEGLGRRRLTGYSKIEKSHSISPAIIFTSGASYAS